MDERRMYHFLFLKNFVSLLLSFHIVYISYLYRSVYNDRWFNHESAFSHYVTK